MRAILFLGLALAQPASANVTFRAVHFPVSGVAGLRITMRVVNSPVVPVKRLAQAEKIAAQILGKAGVEVAWVDCAGPTPYSGIDACGQDSGPVDFRLYLSAAPSSSLRGDAMGFAVLPPPGKDSENYAGVSYAMVEEAAKSLEVEAVLVLGTTLAHEIGHLLRLSHSPGGVMSPRLRRQQLGMAARGELSFTAEEAGRMRAEVARRLAR